MEELENIELKDLQILLSKKVHPKKFGYRKTYIYSHIILKLQFELFVTRENIGIKTSRANLEKFEIVYLTKLIRKIDINFKHRIYGDKKFYSIWELDVYNFSDVEIGNLLNMIDQKLIQP